jgi:enterochelin esterase-like enzyme
VRCQLRYTPAGKSIIGLRCSRQAGLYFIIIRMPVSCKPLKLLWLCLFCLIATLTACSPPPSIAQSSASLPASPSTPSANTPEASPAPAFDDTTIQGCLQPGSLQHFSIQSELLHAPLSFDAFIPPCFSASGQDTYPVLYLLHGQTYDQSQWQKLGVMDLADRLILSGLVQPFLIVMPLEQFQYRPSEGNAFPRALVAELLPWVEKNLRARLQKNWRAIGGISRGASWAMRLGLENAQFFGAVAGHSLPTFPGDMKQLPQWLERIPPEQLPRLYLDIGNGDPEVKSAIQFEQILNNHGIPNEWHLNAGRHNEGYWRTHLQEYLQWYTAGWQVDSSP